MNNKHQSIANTLTKEELKPYYVRYLWLWKQAHKDKVRMHNTEYNKRKRIPYKTNQVREYLKENAVKPIGDIFQ